LYEKEIQYFRIKAQRKLDSGIVEGDVNND